VQTPGPSPFAAAFVSQLIQEKSMPKLIVKASKPRNPLVAAVRFRRAGRHGADQRTARREGRQALERELSKLDLPRDMRSKPPCL
jgi:hypothetical protein